MRRWFRPTVVLFVAIASLGACATTQRGLPENAPAIGESDMPHVEPKSTAAGAASTAVPPAASATSPASSGAPSAPPPSDGRAGIPEDFPAGTRSLKLREVAHVLEAPSSAARYIGKIVGGTRVAWRRTVAPDPPPDPNKRRRPERCTAWVEIEPRGWLCKTLLIASPDEPSGVKQPVLKAGRPTPDDYFKVMSDETKVFKNEDDVRADVVDKLISTKVMLIANGVIHVDETPYMKTDHGLIEADRLARFWPSDFTGILARDRSTVFPFGWVFFERGARKPPVLPSPDAKGEPVRTAVRREIVRVLEERDGFVRIGDGEWIERKHVRIARLTDPPTGVSDADQWVDVDRDEQVLVAYQGKTPVFSTLVSTGGKKPTPLATYRVRAKAATTSMDGDPTVPNRYEVSAVPWAVRFGEGLFIHGVYWHDGFGGARSHGCVNISPKDAAFFYDWIGPPVPDGWSEVEVPIGSGPIVRVRDHDHPNPPPFDYSKEAQVLRLPPKPKPVEAPTE